MGNKKDFPILYKKTSTGAIQQWEIMATNMGGHGAIDTIFGQVDGKLQSTRDIIKEGKNAGKVNETSSYEQAIAEAKSKYEKQLKKGYVTSIKDAENDVIDEIIEGGILPMLAHKFRDHAHKISYPALVQPKFDGIRCIAILKNGKCTLWSRSRKQIHSMPHIVAAIENGGHQDVIFDGELYNHLYKDNFEHITHLVAQDNPCEGHEVVQLHIYDTAQGGTNEQRQDWLKKELKNQPKNSPLVLVKTIEVDTEEDVMTALEECIADGYEGCMVRNKAGKYVNKRSYDLLKVKEFDDAEFKIVGVEEGRGKLVGHAIFVCITADGTEFRAKMQGDTAKLKEYFEDHKLWKGRELVVKYQGITKKNNVPRFPVGLRLKEQI